VEDPSDHDIYRWIFPPALLALVVAAAGLEPVYKGKLHLTKGSGVNGTFLMKDAKQYGWTRWNPTGGDKGANQVRSRECEVVRMGTSGESSVRMLQG